MHHPHQYPRRVLLCVTGTSPQIVTETLYALAVEPAGGPPFMPTEIRVLTTSKGAEQAKLSLLAEDRDMFGRLCRDHGLEGIHFDASCIEVFKDAEGRPVEDILTPQTNELAADHITRVVAELTNDKNAAVHASIAGGRKTMGFYLGYAMSLFGREQDRVSHVLVSEGFDNHREFFYKPARPVTLKNPLGWEMSTADAVIHLAEIPIVRLRSSEFDAMSHRRMGFSDAVARANRMAGSAGELRIRMDRSRAGSAAGKGVVWLCGEPIKFSQVETLLLHWFALRRLAGEQRGDDGWIQRSAFDYVRGTKRNLGYLDELYELGRSVYGSHSNAYEALRKSLETVNEDTGSLREPVKWLETTISGVHRKIQLMFGTVGAERFGIVRDGVKGALCYRLALPPRCLRIED